jgi:hypothetical protein
MFGWRCSVCFVEVGGMVEVKGSLCCQCVVNIWKFAIAAVKINRT